jgi:SAM-dependent methyltransferase
MKILDLVDPFKFAWFLKSLRETLCDNSFAVIVAVGVFHHHLDLRKATSECEIFFQRNGLLVVFEPNSLWPSTLIGRLLSKTKIHTTHERFYTYWSFIRHLRENGFTEVETFSIFFGFIFPFILASNYSFISKKTPNNSQTINMLFEKIPII